MTYPWVPQNEDQGPFKWGVAAFHPTSSGFVAWTKYDGQANLICEVSEDHNFKEGVFKPDVDATGDGTVRAIVKQREPKTTYFYRFRENGGVSVISRTGRAKTLPKSDALLELPFRIGFANCTDVLNYDFIGYDKLARENLDLVVFLGDYIYGDTNGRSTLEQYEDLYRTTRANPYLKVLHASVACFAIWDDHEVENDYSGELAPSAEDFKRRRLDAYRAYYEYFGLDEALDDYREIYRFADIGSAIRLYLIDGRKYRDGIPCPDVDLPYQGGKRIGETIGGITYCDRLIPIKEGGCKDLWNSRSYLGKPQEDWLYDAFRSSKATWNIIANNTMFCPLLRRSKNNDEVVNTDAWSGYPKARNDLVRNLRDRRVKNPIFVTGDMHCFIAGKVTKEIFDPKSDVVAAEFVTSALAYCAGKSPIGPCLLDENHHPVGYCDPDSTHLTTFPDLHRGFTLMEIGATAVRVLFMEIDRDSDFALPGAAFEVKSLTPGFSEIPIPPPRAAGSTSFDWR